ncbi:MAG: alkaline phosphatase family protein [Phycisphaerae bacterium]|nr:alkaline phosphatase family protein [Phycisphaerae bacterium]NUQ45825.1 alkaline phosphatase family protein [Phycisphaerae bacterium]
MRERYIQPARRIGTRRTPSQTTAASHSARAPAARRCTRHAWVKPAALIVVVAAGVWWWTRTPEPSAHPTRCVVVGLDGLDPNLVRQWMEEGVLPNLKKLADEGGMSPLATSNPPQSPVAWSVFATGQDPGGTGIFDFVHRRREDYAPYESMVTAAAAGDIHLPLMGRMDPYIDVGQWRLPLKGGSVTLNRKGTPFWEYLDKADVPAVVLRLPSNFPPPPGKTRQLSGMGTPDLTGSTGSHYFWTDRTLSQRDRDEAGTNEQLFFEADGAARVVLPEGGTRPPRLFGPPNSLLADGGQRERKMELPFEMSLDRANGTMRVHLNGNDAVLRPGDWSEWMPIVFVMNDYFWGNPHGQVRFWLKAVEPNVELYATAIHFDPTAPAMPITNPPEYAQELADRLGRFSTLGMPEDDKAFRSRLRPLNEEGFLGQCKQILDEVWRTTSYELDRYRGGLFFTYFRTSDVMGHMTWFLRDPNHSAHDPEAARIYGDALKTCYVWLDEKVGEIRRRVGDDVLFIVMSDHGFAPRYKDFMLNSWLADNGWLVLYPWAEREYDDITEKSVVDWEKTRAYAAGLNGLYINLQGREAEGSVPPEEREQVVRELCAALEQIVDPLDGERVITHAYTREEAYHGPCVDEAPDIIVGYNRTFGTTGSSGQGRFPPALEVEKDGRKIKTWVRTVRSRWSGDHCCDPVHVPGTLIANRPITKADASLTDMAPTILQEFGIAKPADMIGAPVVAPQSGGQ